MTDDGDEDDRRWTMPWTRSDRPSTMHTTGDGRTPTSARLAVPPPPPPCGCRSAPPAAAGRRLAASVGEEAVHEHVGGGCEERYPGPRRADAGPDTDPTPSGSCERRMPPEVRPSGAQVARVSGAGVAHPSGSMAVPLRERRPSKARVQGTGLKPQRGGGGSWVMARGSWVLCVCENV